MPARKFFRPASLGLSRYILTTGCTDGYAYSTLRVMRDAGPGGSNVSNDDCKSSEVTTATCRGKHAQDVAGPGGSNVSNDDCKSSEVTITTIRWR